MLWILCYPSFCAKLCEWLPYNRVLYWLKYPLNVIIAHLQNHLLVLFSNRWAVPQCAAGSHIPASTSGFRKGYSSLNSMQHEVSYVIPAGHLTSQARQSFIVARSDKVAIPLHDDSLTCALDKLFKFYWLCNVPYPTQLASVFIFLEYYLWLVSIKDCETIQSVGAHWQASGFDLNQLGMYRCLTSKQPGPGEIRKLIRKHWHLRVVHSLSDSQEYTIICRQNSCQWTYKPLKGTLLKRCVFGEIVHLLPQLDKDTALAFVQVVNVNCFDDHFYAYAVERDDEFKLAQIPGDLSDFRPLDFNMF